MPAIDSNGHGAVYEPAPFGIGMSESSAGCLRQANVSWKKRLRRKAKAPKYWACTPGSVSTPAVIGPLVQVPSVKVPVAGSNVGQLLVAAVKRFVYGWPSTVR